MVSEGDLLFQLGAIMLLAFVGAALAKRFKQSVMIGYIVIGILIGPFIHIDLLGFEYTGLIHNTGVEGEIDIISVMSQIGLILLLFFVGLDFSFSRLTKTRTPAFLLGFVNISMNLFGGFAVGMLFGWPLIDTFFLAGVMAMNSTAIAAKAILDMNRSHNTETELILTFEVIGTFVAMIILSVGSGLVSAPTESPSDIWQLIVGNLVFILFFLFIAVYSISKIVPWFEKIKSDELFILMALGVLFLVSAIAEVCYVPTIIGAFFVGMLFAESKLADRLKDRLTTLKDAFVAIFFIAFGMMIDPAFFWIIVPMLLVAIPVVILNDVVFASIVTYLMGYSAKASTAVGTTIAGRAEESILYASVGSKVKIATKGAELMPFAGAFCFVMSALTPMLMRNSSRMASGFSRILPRRILFGASLVSRTLSKAILPSSLPLFKRARKTGASMVALFLVLVALLVTDGWLFYFAIVAGFAVVVFFSVYAKREIHSIVRQVNYANLGLGESVIKRPITLLVSRMISGGIAATIIVALVWRFFWWASIFVLIGYLVSCILMLRGTAKRLSAANIESHEKYNHLHFRHLSLPKRLHRKEPKHIEVLNKMAMNDFRYQSRTLRRSIENGQLRL